MHTRTFKTILHNNKIVDSSRNLIDIRVHIESAMRRIKEFQILSDTIPIT